MLKLRSYQNEIKYKVVESWQQGHRNVLIVLPTGAGKTVVFSSLTIDMALVGVIIDTVKNIPEKHPTVIMVHRQELLQQISVTLAHEGIHHNIIAQPATIAAINKLHRLALNKTFYNPQAPVTVMSVDTFKSREDRYKNWALQIKFWICDEAAHVLADNKWGKVISHFTNALGLGVTATPDRLDGKGLGRKTKECDGQGVFDVMHEGPTTYQLIKDGHLCDYEFRLPESDYRQYLGEVKDGKDWSQEQQTAAASKSSIKGDVVKSYIKYAMGKQTILFAPTIESAKEMVINFNKAGVVAVLLTSENSALERYTGVQKFKKQTNSGTHKRGSFR